MKEVLFSLLRHVIGVHWECSEQRLVVYFIAGVGQLATVAFGYILENEGGSSKDTKGHTSHAW